MYRRRICVITGTRAEYGLLRWLIEGIHQSPILDLQLVATGMHLSPEFGLTVQAIEADGYRVDRKVEMLLSSDTAVGITKSMGLGLIGFADVLADLQPDLVLVLGDRYESFAAATAALIARIPIAHIHGGELTEGAFDDALRHSITKMSHFHFVAAEEYQKRVLQLGESPERVFLVGGLGVDSILREKLLSREELQSQLEFTFQKRNLLITFHPVTLERNTSAAQMNELLAALSELDETGLLFTMPNADTDGRILFRQIEDFCRARPLARAYTSLGQRRYLSCMRYVDGVVGNSSSGLAEAPTFKVGTVNIGDRQRGRLRASSVIDCVPEREAILRAIEQLLSDSFKEHLLNTVNPYGEGGASAAIVAILEQNLAHVSSKKEFHDL